MPVVKELPDYRPETARRDIVTALTVAALAVPAAMTYAELAGLTAVAGLYALAALGLIEPAAWRRLWDTDRVEFTVASATAAGVVCVGVLEAILFAAGLSIIDVVRRSASPRRGARVGRPPRPLGRRRRAPIGA